MTTPIVTREPVKVIADILKSELGLDANHIILDYEKFNIPPDPGLYVALSYVSGKAIGNNNYSFLTADTTTEVQQVAMHHVIQIDVMSFDSSARTRKEEVIMALRSIFAEQAQDSNGMQIARIPGEFQNVSSLEETKMLNRFTMTIAVKSIYIKEKPVTSYYETFTNQEEFDQ